MKPMGRCFVSALLIFAMLLGGCASAAPTEGTTEPPVTDAPATEAPTTEAPATEAPTTEAPTEPVVTEPITRENIVTDAHRDVKTFDDGEVLHAFPQINLIWDYAQEINEKIRQEFEGRLNDEGVMNWYGEYSYQYYVYEDILTVILRNASGESIADREGFDIAEAYQVYRLHISDGSPATTEEILALAGVTEEAFYKRVEVGTGNAFCTFFYEDAWENYLAAGPLENDLFLLKFRQTISEENVHRAIPYLNDDGELWFMGYVCQIAGADDHCVLRPYEQTEKISPHYEYMLALAAEADTTN